MLTLFRCCGPAVTPDFAHATVHPAIHESQLRPAFATLLRSTLTIPFSYRRGNHLKHLLCQGCHGKLLFVPLSGSTLFLVVSRACQPRVWNAWSKIINTKTSRDYSGLRFYSTGDSRHFPKPLDFPSRGLAAFPYPEPATLEDLEHFRHLSRDARC